MNRNGRYKLLTCVLVGNTDLMWRLPVQSCPYYTYTTGYHPNFKKCFSRWKAPKDFTNATTIAGNKYKERNGKEDTDATELQ